MNPLPPNPKRPSLPGPPAPAATFTLELPTTADFQPGGLGHQCAVLCKAGCCRYYSLPLETPRSAAEFDDVRWYLMHEGTHVYKFGKDWFLLVLNECKNLLPNNLCAVYETRPRICREYDARDCEFTDDVSYDLYFESATQLEEWLEKRKAERAHKRKAAAASRARPRTRKAASRATNPPAADNARGTKSRAAKSPGTKKARGTKVARRGTRA